MPGVMRIGHVLYIEDVFNGQTIGLSGGGRRDEEQRQRDGCRAREGAEKHDDHLSG